MIVLRSKSNITNDFVYCLKLVATVSISRIVSRNSTRCSSLLIQIVIALGGRDTRRWTTYFRISLYLCVLSDREANYNWRSFILWGTFFFSFCSSSSSSKRWWHVKLAVIINKSICLSFVIENQQRRQIVGNSFDKARKKRLIEFIVFDSVLLLSLSVFCSLFSSLLSSFLFFSFSLVFEKKKKSAARMEKLMTLKSSAQWTRERTRTITWRETRKEEKRGRERNRKRQWTQVLLSTHTEQEIQKHRQTQKRFLRYVSSDYQCVWAP